MSGLGKPTLYCALLALAACSREEPGQSLAATRPSRPEPSIPAPPSSPNPTAESLPKTRGLWSSFNANPFPADAVKVVEAIDRWSERYGAFPPSLQELAHGRVDLATEKLGYTVRQGGMECELWRGEPEAKGSQLLWTNRLRDWPADRDTFPRR